MEYAAHVGWIHDERSALSWLRGMSRRAVGSLDLPILKRLHHAWCANDSAAVQRWTAQLLASRETAELRAEDRHLGRSLARILVELDLSEAAAWSGELTTWATVFALAGARWQIGRVETLSGYTWAWAENQVIAAVKLVPLGQSAGQRMLRALADAIPNLVADALRVEDAAIAVGTPSHALASALHETQYTRLFRS